MYLTPSAYKTSVSPAQKCRVQWGKQKIKQEISVECESS